MLSQNLFNEVLIEPASRSDTLIIVSGYATASMALKHLEKLYPFKPSIKLIIGMAGNDGIRSQDHSEFVEMETNLYKGNFNCRYVFCPPPVHSKVYGWFSGLTPSEGFIGSANYTQQGFSNLRKEVMEKNHGEEIIDYYNSLLLDSISCVDSDVENKIKIYKSVYIKAQKKLLSLKQIPDYKPIDIDLNQTNQIMVSLLTSKDEIGERSGLNWGQREGREPNQAYIPLKSGIFHSSFFPHISERFTLITDDNQSFIVTRAQASGKAIETPQNNSLLGAYFRKRLNLKSGSFVRKEDLIAYGRTDVKFYKIDDETYFMDFSV